MQRIRKARFDFAAADRAVTLAAARIERAIGDLLVEARHVFGDDVPADYAIGQLIGALAERNPEALDWLNRRRIDVSAGSTIADCRGGLQ
jgi:hypothetical protein